MLRMKRTLTKIQIRRVRDNDNQEGLHEHELKSIYRCNLDHFRFLFSELRSRFFRGSSCQVSKMKQMDKSLWLLMNIFSFLFKQLLIKIRYFLFLKLVLIKPLFLVELLQNFFQC